MGIDGKRLRALREQRGLYLQDVADFLGVTRQAYMKYENGETKNPRKLEQLARFFNVTTDYLLGNDAAPSQHAPAPSYLDQETVEMAEQLKNNLSMRMLFDASKDASSKNLEIAANLLRQLKGNEGL